MSDLRPGLPWTEAERLAALRSYGILDTPPERAFDDLVRLTGQLLDAPIVAVNLIDADRQWFKSELGLGVREMPLDDSICKFALLEADRMIVLDTRDDARFNCNPLVTGGPGLRFYAGQVLRTEAGLPLGTLCVLDTVPRPGGLTALQAEALATLARQVLTQLELRRVVFAQERLLEELAETDRRKSEFLATLAHELRNPLAPISSGLTVLKLGGDSAAAVAKIRGMMERQVAQMVRLIDDLLDVARISGGKIELQKSPVALRSVLASAIETSTPFIERGGHQLLVHQPVDQLVLDADPARIAQVLSNLLNNAAKYTPLGGRIEVNVRQDGVDAVIEVADNGIGIPVESLSEIFLMFNQVGPHMHRAQGGLGVGLSLVKRLAEMHGGAVHAHSAGSGSGSTFTLRLPLARQTLH